MQRPTFRFSAFAAVFGLALALLAGPAFGQLQTGDLYGKVTDDQGEALPGVTVTLTGIGAPRVQITNAGGEYRFLGLPPGKYTLTFQLEGFSTVEYPNVTVSVGGNVTVNATLTPAVEETITVTSAAPLLDERALIQGNNISAAELDQIPTARDPWSLLSLTPGVITDRINVGGNESGQQSNFLGTGSMGTDNTFAIDGVVLTDMAAVGGSLSYYDFGAFEEVQFTTSSADVSKATSGVTVNQVTKRGTNEWRFGGRYLRTDGDLQSNPQTLIVSGEEVEGNQIDVVEELGVNFGGPLWEEHLWIWAAYGESDIGNVVIGGQLDRTELEDFNSKLNFQGGSNSGVLHYWTNDKVKTGRGAGPDRSPETTHNQITPADIWKFEDSHVFGSNFFVTGLWSNNTGVFNAAPQGGRDADVFWDAEGILHGSYWDFAQKGIIDQGRLDASYFFNTGGASHELKFGGSFRSQENTSGTVWPGGKLVYDCQFYGCSGTAPDTAVVWMWRDRSLAIESTYDSAWIQDTIQTNRWTINLGLRFDDQGITNLASSSPTNPDLPSLIPQLDFSGNDGGAFNWESVVPRIGVTYALGEERRTLLRGSYSQYAQQLGQGVGARVNPVGGYNAVIYYFTDADGDLVLDQDEFDSFYYPYYYNIDPDNPTSAEAVNLTDPGLDPAMTDELTFGIEHGVSRDFAVGATVTYRNITDILESRLLVDDGGTIRPAQASDYVASTATCEASDGGPCLLPDGTAVPTYTVYDLDGVSSTGGRQLVNGDREQDYLGVTLSATKRLANRWRLAGHLNWNDWDWKMGSDFLFFDDPTDTTVDNSELALSDGDEVVSERSAGSGNKGNVFAGSGWSFNVNTLYEVAPDRPWGFNLGASLTGREGFVSPPYAPESMSRRVQLTALDSFRNEDIILLDARIEKEFDAGDLGITLSIDGFNLLDETYVLQRERRLTIGSANNVTEFLSPRVFRIGVTLNFN